MSVLSVIRESKSGSLVIAAVAYVLAMGGGLYLDRAAGPGATAELGGALLMSVALIVTALVMRAPVLPRWSLLATAGIFAAGMILPALVAPAAGDSPSLIGTWGYGWLYLMLLGGTRAAGPRWCHSPWVVVGCAVVLGVAGVIARGRL